MSVITFFRGKKKACFEAKQTETVSRTRVNLVMELRSGRSLRGVLFSPSQRNQGPWKDGGLLYFCVLPVLGQFHGFLLVADSSCAARPQSPLLNSFWSMLLFCQLMAHHGLGEEIYCLLPQFPSPRRWMGNAFCKALVLIWCDTEHVVFNTFSQGLFIWAPLNSGKPQSWIWKNPVFTDLDLKSSISLTIGNTETRCLLVT